MQICTVHFIHFKLCENYLKLVHWIGHKLICDLNYPDLLEGLAAGCRRRVAVVSSC